MKRGQAALEFLITYGWAFLVLLLMVGGLAYFGVLDPTQWLPEKCQFSTGAGCTEVYIAKQEIAPGVFKSYFAASLVNNFGKTIVFNGSGALAEVSESSNCQEVELLMAYGGVSSFADAFYSPQFSLGASILYSSDSAVQSVYQSTFPDAGVVRIQPNEPFSIVAFCSAGDDFAVGERPTVQMDIPFYTSGSKYLKRLSGEFTATVYENNDVLGFGPTDANVAGGPLVDVIDFNVVLFRWQCPGRVDPVCPTDWQTADINLDGIVDGNDVIVFILMFGLPTGQ